MEYKEMKKFRKNKKRICAGILAFVLSASPILNDIPSFFLSSEAATYGDTMQAYIKDSGFRQYCIDGMSPNNALGVADQMCIRDRACHFPLIIMHREHMGSR